MWLIYGVTTICRKSSSDYLYKYPPVMHWLIYLNFSVINVLNVITLLFWSKQLFMVDLHLHNKNFKTVHIFNY